jgi:endogenous inhibitor of DNA gyrase (YacG/DUF329 family)
VVDLAAWADERYRIPGEPVSQEPELPGDDRQQERAAPPADRRTRAGS